MADELRPGFDVRATAPDGRDLAARGLGAASVEALVREMTGRGLQVSAVRGRAARRLFEPRGFSAEEFAVFNAELAAACRRSVPLPGALRALSRDLGSRRARRQVEEVAAELEAGADLAGALARRPGAFPPAYVALVRAGLASGSLAGTLLLFSEESRLAARVRRSTSAALIYPLAMLFGATLLMALAGGVILPMVSELAGEVFGEEKPLALELFLDLAPAMQAAPVVLLALLAAGALAWRLVSRGATGAVLLGRLALGVPLIGRFLRAVALARFCRMLAAALAGRVGVPDSVALAGLATGNAAVQAAAAEAAEAIREGRPLSGALGQAPGCFPSTLVWMLSLGEARGEVAGALEEYARLQEEHADRLGQVVPTVIVTVVTVLAAAMLFFSVLAVMGPLLKALLALTS